MSGLGHVVTKKLVTDYVDADAEDLGELFTHPGDAHERVPTVRIEIDKDVDVAVGSGIPPGHRTEQSGVRCTVAS